MSIVYLAIDGDEMPCPTSISVAQNDLDSENTTRAQGTGYMKRERIRQGVYQVDYGFEQLTDDELKTLVEHIEPEKVTIKFWYGKTVEATGYFAGSSAEMTSSPGGSPRWSFSVTFTEY